MAETDCIVEMLDRAMAGDRDAQGDLWSKFRTYMHRVIRWKASDLSLEWAVDPDDIYDSFFLDLFKRQRQIQFQNAIHFAHYVEKSLRRSTRRRLRGGLLQYRLDVCSLDEASSSDVDIMEDLMLKELSERAYASLTERERAICSLVKKGCRWREVGQRLELAEDTARMIHRRAVIRVRRELLWGKQ